MDWAMTAAVAIFPLLGFLMLYFGLSNVWQAHRSNSWAVADGLVVASTVTPHGDSYTPKIVAAYKAAGQSFSTDRVHFGQTAGSGDSAESDMLLLRYPEGATVRVFYDPRRPWDAVLEPGFDTELLWLPGGGLAFALPGIMFMILHLGGDLSSSALKAAMTLFALIFALIGVALLVPGSIRLWHAYASVSWPSTPGTLLKKAEAERDATGTHSRTTTYSEGRIYEFTVNGKLHFSSTHRFGESSETAVLTDRTNVTVYYKPSNPDIAVLEPGYRQEALYLPGAGLAFLLFGLAVFFFAIPALT